MLLSAAGDSVLVPLCEMGEVSSAFRCFPQHSSPWKELSGRKSSTCSPLCPWVFELAVFLPALGTPCSFSLQGQIMDATVLLMRCRAWTSLQVSKIFSSVTLQMSWKCSFVPFYFPSFPFFFLFLCCEDDSTAGIPDPFFSCLFAHCCAHTLLYVHSPALAPERVSGFRKKSWVSRCCSCERCSDAILLYLLRDFMGTPWCLLQHTAMQVWVNSCFSCKREAWLTQLFSWPHAYIIFPRYI